ncbi:MULTISPECIES: methyltransferase [unclassified Streptomyces]|uniref:methyltransferase n=1 Tax=unclassified Streptomyces TaxID=2593676 RepID=UPI00093C8A15|nr:methyltransferase [Streptomyces sp. CB02414]
MNATNPQDSQQPDPGQVMGILSGYWQTRMLITATESDLFTQLSGTSATAAELSERLGYVMPGAGDFFLALAGLGLLESQDGRYRNSPAAERFLVRGRPEFIGGYLQFCDRELNPAWDGLGQSLRTGKPHNAAAVAGSNPYHSLYADEEATDSFLASMDMFNTPIAARVAALDWSRYESFVDVGGARGNLAHHLACAHPHLKAGVFDLPQLARAFDKHMAALAPVEPITFHGGDFFSDPLPGADALIFGHILHNWGTEDRLKLLRSAYDAVRPGGAVIIYDPMVSDDTPPLFAVMASLSMLVWSAGGHEYSVEDCHGWLKEAGFRPETVGLANSQDDVLIIGHKDR